ncbi:Auxin response factor [Arachis hypogaea]|nr:Auxin response factor [Arachis hypogaea]
MKNSVDTITTGNTEDSGQKLLAESGTLFSAPPCAAVSPWSRVAADSTFSHRRSSHRDAGAKAQPEGEQARAMQESEALRVSSVAATSHCLAPTFPRTSPPIRIFSSFSHKDSILIPPTKTHLYASFFCTLICLYVVCGRFCKASCAFSSMCGLGLVPVLPLWNRLFVNILVHSLCKVGELDLALEYLRSNDVDTVTYNTVVWGLCVQGLEDQGFGLLSEMLKRGICVDSITCKILVKGYCRIGLVQYAEWVMYNLVDGGIPEDVIGLNTLIDGYCEAGLMNHALVLMENGWRGGIRPDIVTYNTLLKAFCKMGDIVRAESLLSEILGFQNDEEFGQLKNRFVKTKAEIRDLQPTPSAYTTVIDGYAKHSGIEESLSLYERMIMNGIIPDVAEEGSDEVYCQVLLVPESEQVEKNLRHGVVDADGEDDTEAVVKSTTPHMFCKTLTASDTSTHGGFSVPRRAAEDCFPPLDYSQQRPSQELVAKDLHGLEWRFRHIYRGQPRRHLLTTGWSAFVNKKKLVSGDAVLFLRGDDGELRLGSSSTPTSPSPSSSPSPTSNPVFFTKPSPAKSN